MKNDLINSGAKPILKALSGREEGIFQQIQQDMDAAIDLQEVLNRLLRWAVELVGARDGSLMLIDEKDELCFCARFGRSLPEGKVERTFKPGEGIAGWVVQNGKPYICYDTETDTNFTPIIAGFPIRSLVSVPIKSHGVALGVINVDSPEPNRFSEADAELLVSLANQTAVAIERAELLDSLRQIGEKTLGGAEDLYEYIVDGVRRLTRCPVSMWQVDETGKQTKIVASRGISAEYTKKAKLDLDRSVTGKAIRERKIIPVLDIQADPDFQNKEDAAREGWQSMLAVPLLAGPEQAVGTLSIYSKIMREEFTLWELDLLRAFASQAGVAIKNAGLIEELQERAIQLERLQKVMTTISGEPADFDKVLLLVVESLSDIFTGASCTIRLYDSKTDEFAAKVGTGVLEDLVDHPPSPAGSSWYVVQTKAPRYLEGDALVAPLDGGPAVREDILERGVKAAAYLPLISEEEVIGILYVDLTTPHRFSQDDRRILELFADQAAIAIRNAQLFQELDERATQLERLHKVTATISAEPPELAKVLDLIVDSLSDIFEGASCAIRLYDSKTDSFSPQTATGVFKDLVDYPPRSNGTSQHVINSKTSRYIEDTSIVPPDGGPTVRTRFVQQGVRAIALLPFLSGADVTGILYVGLTSPHRFFQNDKHILELFADQAAITIENARLFEELAQTNMQLDRRVQELEVLTEIGRTVSNLGIDEILNQIYTQADKIMDARNIQIAFYDEDTDIVEFPFARSDGKEVEVGIGDFAPRKRGRDRYGLTEYVIHQRKAEFSEGDMWRWAEERGIQLSEKIPTNSWIGAPLKVWDRERQAEKVIGLISIQSYEEEDAYGESDLRVLETMANQAAVAIENARLHSRIQDQLERKAGDIEASREIDRAIIESIRPSPELQSALELIMEKALERTGASSGNIMWHDEAVGDLVMRAGRGILEGKERSRQKIGEGIVGLVAQERKTYRVGDVTEEPWKGIYIPFIPDIRSELATPLEDGETLLGVLNVEDAEIDAFDEEDVRWLEDLAVRAVIAIRGAQAYEALQQEQERRIEAERFAYLGHAADGIAHRINNTIALLPLCVRDIKKHMVTVDAVVGSNLEMVDRNAQYVLDLAEELQKPSRPSEAGRFDINLLVKEAIGVARPPSEVEVVTKLDETLPKVQTKKLLIDVFVELITNAVEAMTGRPKRLLEIGSRQAEDKCVEVWFTDTGKGIPEEEQEQLFELFYTTAEKKEPAAGVAKGFGLWWIKTFLAWQGGEISVESQVDKKTTFVVKLRVEVQP